MKHRNLYIMLALIIMNLSSKMYSMEWLKTSSYAGYKTLPQQEEAGYNDAYKGSPALKQRVKWNITNPNEIHFLSAVEKGDTSTINAMLKTSSFTQNTSRYFFNAAAAVARDSGYTALANKLEKQAVPAPKRSQY